MQTSFITNQKNNTLKKRIETLTKDSSFFDCLVGYFYSSGFSALYPSLQPIEKIRILIGINTDQKIIENTEQAKEQSQLPLSHAETEQEFANLVQKEMEESEDSSSVEEGVKKFIEWIENKKLEIRVYPSRNIHAKLYIMTFKKGDRNKGCVITGSSNLTKNGLEDNLEFNVELRDDSDYDFAENKFAELWKDGVDVNEKYIQTIQNKTFFKEITPYHLYLKFLYEYFQDELSISGKITNQYSPHGFKEYEYQTQAVQNAKKILLAYGGVFISDVVGLGKTYISAMLANQLDGRTLVIAPPVLIEESNRGSWRNIFSDFKIAADFESLGKLDNLINRGVDKYTNIIIDEAHRFRTETNTTYEKLAIICRGKKLILVTATPYNNSPQDILSLLKLFQKTKKSTIPNVADLESFFGDLEKELKKIDKNKNYAEYLKQVKNNAREIRNQILKHLMVRRTRKEIKEYFYKNTDPAKSGLKFPEVKPPQALFYELNEEENNIFDRTIELITKNLKYARYTPLLYHENKISQDEQSQKNMGRFMKILLIKRLESSFYAFKKSVTRFLNSYKNFIETLDSGFVYLSKNYTNKIFEFLDNDDDEAVEQLIQESKAQKYVSEEFNDDFKKDLESDLNILKKIQTLWQQVDRDPKLLKFLNELSNNVILKDKHLIIFTESKETAQYLFENINKKIGKVLLFTGASNDSIRKEVLANFDANARDKKQNHRILISTEVLSEGVNLHRANVVINYDIPWNPTRMMQRVGRINRIDTSFEEIYIFNFFPTKQSNEQINLKKIAETKIHSFLTLLGGDAHLLTEGEPIGSHELFDRLTSKKIVEEDEEESELKYLAVIREIQEKDSELFKKIKQLPKKARSSKQTKDSIATLVTYFRKGKLQKFFQSSLQKAEELDFIAAAKLLESNPNQKTQNEPKEIYEFLGNNKQAFKEATTEASSISSKKRRSNRDLSIMKILKATRKNNEQLTDTQEKYLEKMITQLKEGGLPEQTKKNISTALKELKEEKKNPLKVLAILQNKISDKLLQNHYVEQSFLVSGKREVILSLYLSK